MEDETIANPFEGSNEVEFSRNEIILEEKYKDDEEWDKLIYQTETTIEEKMTMKKDGIENSLERETTHERRRE